MTSSVILFLQDDICFVAIFKSILKVTDQLSQYLDGYFAHVFISHVSCGAPSNLLAFLCTHFSLKANKWVRAHKLRTLSFLFSLLLISPSAIWENFSSVCAGRSTVFLLFILLVSVLQTNPTDVLWRYNVNVEETPVEIASHLGRTVFVYDNY